MHRKSTQFLRSPNSKRSPVYSKGTENAQNAKRPLPPEVKGGLLRKQS